LPSEFRTPLPLLSIDRTFGDFGVVQLFLAESLHCGDPIAAPLRGRRPLRRRQRPAAQLM